MDKNEILPIIDTCLTERLESLDPRPKSADVRKVSLTCQKVLYEIYNERRANGALGEAEDILRNDNIKGSIADLPDNVRQLARDIITCAHSRISNASSA